MSVLGQSRHFDLAPITSGLPRQADIRIVRRHVSKVPLPTSAWVGIPSKRCLALPSDPSYSRLEVGLRAMVQEQPVRIERRLSAILAADVAGYSRLMHHDEEATHAKLAVLLMDAVNPAIAEHGGRIVKNTGDGFLAEFPSAVEAVRGAMLFQALQQESPMSSLSAAGQYRTEAAWPTKA
jgi:class 3 adenylate cyclase